MAQLRADQKNYKDAFNQHYDAYIKWNNTNSTTSKRMILAYCVECGLKCLVMKENRIQMVSQAQSDLQRELGEHDFVKLLIRLKQAGPYWFGPFRTEYNNIVEPYTYHQICRYSIRPRQKEKEQVEKYEHQLDTIAKWIRERI